MGSNLQCEGQGRHRGAFVQEVVDKHRASLVVQGGCCSHQGIAERVPVCRSDKHPARAMAWRVCSSVSVQGLGSQKEGGFFFWDLCFSPKVVLLVLDLWVWWGGGVRTNQNMPWLPGHLLQDLPLRKDMPQQCWWSNLVVRSSIRPSFPSSKTTMTHRGQWL